MQEIEQDEKQNKENDNDEGNDERYLEARTSTDEIEEDGSENFAEQTAQETEPTAETDEEVQMETRSSLEEIFAGRAVFGARTNREDEDEKEIMTSTFFGGCGYLQEGENYTIGANCVLQGNLPKLSTQEVVDMLWEEIVGFSDMYQPFEETYRYYGSSPMFQSKFSSLLNGSFESTKTLIELARANEEI